MSSVSGKASAGSFSGSIAGASSRRLFVPSLRPKLVLRPDVAAISDVAVRGIYTAILKSFVKIPLSNYGAGLAETVTTV